MNGEPLGPFWSTFWGIAVPAVIMAVSFILTVWIYLKFAHQGDDTRDKQL